MILRHFEVRDIKDLKRYRYPEKTDMQILSMINEWNKGDCSGRFSEFMSIVHGGQMVGQVFMNEYNDRAVCVSVFVFEPFRLNGFAYAAVKKALDLALDKKYEYAVFLVEKNNVAALNLFEKIVYNSKSEFINPKGVAYYNLRKDF